MNVLRRHTLALMTCGVLAAAAPAPAQDAATVAIENARIVPVSGPEIASGTIVLADGLIRAVGPRVDVPPDAVRIDGSGLTVYPGLIDAMTDLGLTSDSAPSASSGAGGGNASGSRAGAGAPRRRGPADRPASTPWVQAADAFAPDARRLETWRHGGFTTVVAMPSAGILPGQAAVINLSGAPRAAAVVRAGAALPIRLQPQSGFASFPSSLMGVIAYVRQVWADTRHYAVLSQQYEANPRGRTRPEYDRTVGALHEVLTAKRPVLLPATTVPEIDRMLRFGEELDVPLMLYGAHDAGNAVARLSERKVPVLVSAKWPARPRDADPDAVERLSALELRERAPATPAALAAANVPFAFYSDGLANPAEMLTAVRKAIDAGLPAAQALRALTADPAQLFGVGDRLGTLETGKIANVIVIEGDLFDAKMAVRHVFVDGLRFDVPAAPPGPTPAAPSSQEGAR